MQAFHDFWDERYRAPLGAVAPGERVWISIEAQGCQGAPLLRTWVDGVGEVRYPMQEVGGDEAGVSKVEAGEADTDGTDAVEVDAGGKDVGESDAYGARAVQDGWKRFTAQLQPEEAGVVWYQFVLADEWGNEKRYGLEQGKTGGVGAVFDWEPSSFKLVVRKTEDPSGVGRELASCIAGFVRQELNAYELVEVFESAREEHSADAFAKILAELQQFSAQGMFAQIAGLSCSDAQDAGGALEPDESQLGPAKGRLWCARLIQRLMASSAGSEEPARGAALQGAERAGTAAAMPNSDAGGAGGSAEALPASQVEQALRNEDPAPASAMGRLSEETPGQAPQACAFWDADCDAIEENVEDLRRIVPLFEEGEFKLVAYNEDVLGLWRQGGEAACLLINRSLQRAHTVEVPLAAKAVSEVIGGWSVPVAQKEGKRFAQVQLYQLGSALLLFHGERRLESSLQPGIGVLAHITSLPAGDDVSDARSQWEAEAGTLGAPARAFVDWLAQAGVRYWQVLPANPTDEHGSPYAGISAFAGNARLLQLGWPDDAEEAKGVCHPADAFPGEYERFCEREAVWLDPYAAFMAIREKVGEGVVWQDWPKRYRAYKPGMTSKDSQLASAAERCRREQFAFQKQWAELRAYANERGIGIIGDMPIYVSSDSADVWANPGIFQLGPDGKPLMVAGCPPDSFAEDGQVWGNPVYDWDALRASGYSWWLARLKRAMELYDYVRLDHFIGFARYFCIPAGCKAAAGSYRPGPGMHFFQAAYEAFGPLPFVAEDLGSITPAVRALVAACGFPGMDIVQFVDGGDPLAGYRPRPEKIAYTGTHDNQTLVGFVRERYPEIDPEVAAGQLVCAVARCEAPVRVFALQDLAGLGDESRMNVPGTCEGNWAWRATARDLANASACLQGLG